MSSYSSALVLASVFSVRATLGLKSEASASWRSCDEMSTGRRGVGERAFVEGGANFTYRLERI